MLSLLNGVRPLRTMLAAGMILDGIGCRTSAFSSAYRQMMRIGR